MKYTLHLAMIAMVLMTTSIPGHDGATGVVKQRMDAMGVMKDAAKVVAAMVKGETDYDIHLISASANSLLKHALEIPELFPNTEPSRHNQFSEALPAIWQSRIDFEALATTLADHAQKLGTLAVEPINQSAIRSTFANLANTCLDCHEEFRLEK